MLLFSAGTFSLPDQTFSTCGFYGIKREFGLGTGGNLEQQPQPGCKKGSARVRGVGGDGCGAVATAGWIEGSTLPKDKSWGLKHGIFSPFFLFLVHRWLQRLLSWTCPRNLWRQGVFAGTEGGFFKAGQGIREHRPTWKSMGNTSLI